MLDTDDTVPHLAPPAVFAVDAFEQMLAVEGLALPAHRVAQAVDGYRALAAGLEELRRIPLPFLVDVPEPADADRWIEQGGRS
jgi:hypothetical protein